MARFKRRYFGNPEADSKWESNLMDGILKDYKHHSKPHYTDYLIPRTYQPDFILELPTGQVIYVEAKGRFRDSADARRYLFIKEAIEAKGDRFVFLFMSAKTVFPFAKVRKKCGTKRTQIEWAEDQGFEWYLEDNFPKEWI